MTESKLREQIVEIGRSLFERGLTPGSSGNISVRVEDGWLMTPTNSCMGRLDPARIAKLDAAGRHLSGDKPTKEDFLHRAMYDSRPSSQAIVHLHSTYAVAVSCLPDVDPADVLPPITPYYIMRVGKLPMVPYHVPGDPALGPAISGLAGQHTAVLLANHGPVVAGKSLDAATFSIEELEETAKLHLILQGHSPRYLTARQVAELQGN